MTAKTCGSGNIAIFPPKKAGRASTSALLLRRAYNYGGGR